MKNHQKIQKWFNILLIILPFMIIGFSIFRSGTYDLQTISDSLFSLAETPILSDFYDFCLTNFLGGISNDYFNIMFSLLAYMLYYEMLTLLFDFILFIVRFARNYMNGIFDK